ncbi:MAG: NADH-quinone oxidoreductase subunit M [Acidimicrobiales bacterium]
MGLQFLATESGVAFNPLLAMIFLPLVGVAVLTLVPRTRPDAYKQVALSFSAMSGALSLYLITEFDRHDAGFQFVINTTWVKSLGISWHMGVDGISLFLLALTGLLFPIAIAAIKPDREPKSYYTWLLVLMAGSMGVFVALDLVVFFLFFEIVLVPMYFLIGLWGHGERIYAATKFFLYTMFGSALMLVGILATAFLHQKGSGGALTFDVVKIAHDQSLSTGAARWIFGAFALAFAVKVPVFPLHTWLPDAHTEAPTAGSVILAGVMLKLGTYGFIRFGLYLFPEAAHFFAPLFLTLGVIGIIYGAICATVQKDLKRLVAYSSVAHLGFIVLGTFSLTTQGIQGGVLQMVNHGITTPALFMLVGIVYERRHTRQISELSGLQKTAPILAGVFMLAMLASVGLPGLNGFPGEFLTLLGAFKGARWWAVVAASGVILAALYLLWAYQRVFHGEPDGDNATMADLKLSEGLGLLPLLVLIVVLGVYPKPLLERIEPSVKALVHHIGQYSDADTRDVPAPAAATEAEGH